MEFDYTKLPNDIRMLLEAPSEGLRTDYKAGFSWGSAPAEARMDIAKDMAAFGNSGGGRLIIGVKDGTFEIDGSLPVDHCFEPTTIGNDINRWFQPTPRFAVNVYPTPSIPWIVVITVEEFEYEPHICSGGSGPISQGGLYVRTVDGKSKAVNTVSEMRHILRLAAKKLREEAQIITGTAISNEPAFSAKEIEEFTNAARDVLSS